MQRNWRAAWRDTWLLLGQFRASLAAFGVLVIGGGVLYDVLARRAGAAQSPHQR